MTPTSEDPWPLLDLRTDGGSILHRPRWLGSRPLAWLVVAAAGWTTMLVLAHATGTPLRSPAGGVRLPFLRDANVAFMFLVTLPWVLWMLRRDQWLLIEALRTVHREGTVLLEPPGAARLLRRWNATFLRINRQGLVVATCIGLGVAALNLLVYRPVALGHWMAVDGRPSPAGWWFLVCVAFFYTTTAFYVIRSLAICLFLQDLARDSKVRPLPLHPDGSGGLRSLGELGLRNQYILTIFGLNLILLAWTSKTYLGGSDALAALVELAAAAYAVIGPIVFLAPLFPFRKAMLQTKVDIKSQVAQRMRKELRRIREALPQGEIVKADEEIVDRLRKIAAVADELPVWPFDAGTLKKFTAAYITPVIGFLAGIQDLAKHGGNVLTWLSGWLSP